MAYLPTVEFGPGMTSATEIRTAWPSLNEKRKTALVMSLYPDTQRNPKLAANVIKMLDTAIGSEQAVAEMTAQNFVGGMTASYQQRENQPIDEDYIDEKWSQKYKSSINCASPRGFSQKAHCAGRKK
jgi:hypothetical protein